MAAVGSPSLPASFVASQKFSIVVELSVELLAFVVAFFWQQICSPFTPIPCDLATRRPYSAPGHTYFILLDLIVALFLCRVCQLSSLLHISINIRCFRCSCHCFDIVLFFFFPFFVSHCLRHFCINLCPQLAACEIEPLNR